MNLVLLESISVHDPYCLPDETIGILGRSVRTNVHVTVELGLQTTYEETSELD